MPSGSKATTRKNLIKLFFLTGIVFGGYIGYGVLSTFIYRQSTGRNYTRTDNTTTYDPLDYPEIPIYINMEDYLESLVNSDYFNDLSLEEQMEVLENLLGDNVTEYVLDNFDNPQDFLDANDEEIADLLEKTLGSDFSTDVFDQFDDPRLLAAVLFKPMFYVYESNPFFNGFTQEELSTTLFKMNSYDEYDLSTNEWTASFDTESAIIPILDTQGSKYEIKMPIIAGDQVKQTVPTVSPTAPKILNQGADTVSSSPISPTSNFDLNTQAITGGATISGSFNIADTAKSANVSYELLYYDDDYKSEDFYNSLSTTMDDFVSSLASVNYGLNGPLDTDGSQLTWEDFLLDNPNFAIVNSELQTYADFQSATNTYQKMAAIVNYVDENFVLDAYSGLRPGDNEEPIEWFSGTRNSKYTFEFTALTVALARTNDIAARYVSGYKHEGQFSEQLGSSWAVEDASHGGIDMYPYFLGNLNSWLEVFVPINSTDGDWISFDHEPTEITPPDNLDDFKFFSKVDGNYIPDLTGVDRFDAFSDVNTINLSFYYGLEDTPLSSQTITITDVSYGEELGTVVTNPAGEASILLNLDELAAGIHLINFTALYTTETIGNLTMINVVDTLSLTSSLSENAITTNSNEDQPISVSGQITDVFLGEPIRNAWINISGSMLPTESDPQTVPITFSPSFNTTDDSGNFLIASLLPGPPLDDYGREYTVVTAFPAVFDLSQDLLTQRADLQLMFIDMFGPQGYLPTMGNPIENTYTTAENVEIYNAAYYKYTFYVNQTVATNTTIPSYSTLGGPTFGLRSGAYILNFTAIVWEGNDWVANQNISVIDKTEGDRVIANFTTDANGRGEFIYDLAAAALISPENWTVGPHLLEMEWNYINATINPTAEFWIIVEDTVIVNQTSEYFTDGNAGIAANRYHIDTRDPGDADPFTINGTIYDAITGEPLNGSNLFYQILDNNWIGLDPNYLLNGNTNELSSAGQFNETFIFDGSIPLASAPIRTNAYFAGEWLNLSSGWNNTWNTLWTPYFSALPSANDTSDGTILLSDPTAFNYVALINGTDFESYSDILQFNDSLVISGNFTHDALGLDGATITLWANGTQWQQITSDTIGNCSFETLMFNGSIVPGFYNLSVSLVYDSLSGTFTEIYQYSTWVQYDPTPNYILDASINGTKFEVFGADYPTITIYNDTLVFNGTFYYDIDGEITPITGATIELIDEAGPVPITYSSTTNVNGTHIFGVLFDNEETNGTNTFRINITFNEPGYLISMERVINVEYHAYDGFQPTYFLNSTVALADIPGNNYPYTQNLNDYLEFSAHVDHTTSLSDVFNMTGYTVELYDNGALYNTLVTDSFGNANFTVNFDNSLDPGVHNFQLIILYDPVGGFNYSAVSEIISVDYDPLGLYDYECRIEDHYFEFYSPTFQYPEVQGPYDTLDISTALTHNGQGVVGQNVFLYDQSNGTVLSALTNANGVVNFTVRYYPATNNGSRTYRLTTAFTNGTYSFNGTEYISVIFDNETQHQFEIWVNSVQYNDLPGGFYPGVDSYLGANDSLNFTVRFSYDYLPIDQNYIPQDGIQITINNGTEDLFVGNTDVNGYLTYIYTFTNWSAIQTHLFNISMSNSTYDYEIQEYRIVKVNFDPESKYDFTARANNTLFSAYDGNGGEYPSDLYVGNTMDLSIAFDYNHYTATNPVQGALVTLTYLNNNSYSQSTNTLLNGYANFTVNFNNTLIPGLHNFLIEVSYTDYYGFAITFSDLIKINFNPEIGYELVGRLNETLIADLGANTYDPEQSVGMYKNITGFFNFFGDPIAGASVVLYNDSVECDSTVTDANGYYNFTVWFDNTIDPGQHNFSVVLTLVNGTYTITRQTYVLITFNPELGYETDGYIEGNPYSSYGVTTPVYDITQTVGDTLNLSCFLTWYGQPLSGISVDLYDIPEGEAGGIIANGQTNANGMYNFTVLYSNTTKIGNHNYRFEFSFINGSYSISNSTDITVEFDPQIGYVIVPRLNGTIYYAPVEGSPYSYPTTLKINDTLEFSVYVHFKGQPVVNKLVTLDGVSTSYTLTAFTDASGYANFTVTFNGTIDPGLVKFLTLVEFTNGTYTISNSTYAEMTFDETLGFEYIPRVDSLLFSNGETFAETQILNDTLDMSIKYLWQGQPVEGAELIITDTNGTTFDGIYTNIAGIANFSIFYDSSTNTGLHQYSIAVSLPYNKFTLTNSSTIYVNYNPLDTFVFTKYLEDSTVVDYVNMSTGMTANFTYQLTHDGVGVQDAVVTLTDLTNGTTSGDLPSWSVQTDSEGYGTILVYYDQGTHAGPHNYELSIVYDFGLYQVTEANNSLWVFYNPALVITAEKSGYTANFTTANNGPAFQVIGNLTAIEAANGVYDSLLEFQIFDPFDNEVTSDFTITLNSYEDYGNGNFTYTVAQKAGAVLFVGKYTLKVSFNGDLTMGPVDYTYPSNLYVSTLSVEALWFYVYDTPVITSDYSFQNLFDGDIIPGFSEIVLFGNLNYSNSTEIAFQEVSITLYDSNGDSIGVVNTTTDASGYFEEAILIEENWDLDKYRVTYLENPTTYTFTTITQVEVEETFS